MNARGILAGLLLATAPAVFAAAPAVTVTHAWIRWLPVSLPAAGYAEIVNPTGTTVRLVSAASPDYRMVMLHHSRLAQGDSTMVKVSGMDVAPHSTGKLAPGGYHLMLSHATRAIRPGDKVPITLRFADGTSLQVVFSVLPANSTGPAD